MKKIVLIGAGSAVFTQGLIMDIIRSSKDEEWQIGLVDIKPDILSAIGKLAKKMVDATKANVEIKCSTERCDLLEGADYVVTTIGVGGRRAWEQDVFIPRKYGVYQPVGDTAMPGGISRAMRMIPAMIDITEDVKEYCPQAYFFNYSNPMTAICRAIRKKTGAKVTGLCHGVNHSTKDLLDFIGTGHDGVTYNAVGLNHLTFIYELKKYGEDLWPALREKLLSIKQRGVDSSAIGRMGFLTHEESIDPFAWSVFETLGAYPLPGDRHITEFFAEAFPGGSYYGKTFGMDAFSFEKIIEVGDRNYEQTLNTANSDLPLNDDFFKRFGGEHEQLLDIIHSLESDDRAIYSVNIDNNGSYGNLPADAVLEMPAMATKGGFVTLPFNNYPDRLANIIGRSTAIIETTVDAALTGNSERFAEAILMGGYIKDKKAVKNMVADLIEAHKEYLPQF